VLAADGSKAAVDALLAALPTVRDTTTISAIQTSLVDHAEAVTETVLAWKDAHGDVPPAVRDLGDLLVRARVERGFLARKSASGGTGSYPGQFDVLRPDRKRAVEICVDILLDRAAKLPGIHPFGSYQFLVTPTFLIERSELQSMASHAIAELATPDDADVLDTLEGQYVELWRVINPSGAGRPRGIAGRFNRPFEAALSDAILAILARLRPLGAVPAEIATGGDTASFPTTWAEYAAALIEQLAQGYNDTVDDAAALALQLQQFSKAVKLYGSLLRGGRGGSLAAYNLACAYARWSRESRGASEAAQRREAALDAIELAHDKGYPDWTWMLEDRDLDPIRDTDRFRALVARMKAKFDVLPLPVDPSAMGR
jgi:hypothetical protein